jgi:aspartate racemase
MSNNGRADGGRVKTAGIVGGMGPESTIDYYRRIIQEYGEQRGGSGPSLLITSVDTKALLAIAAADDRVALANLLSGAVDVLAAGGADFAVLSANTPHIVFEEVQARSKIPMISIVEVTAEAARAQGLRRLGLIGTRYTMRGEFYPRVFARAGVGLVAPSDADQEYVHAKYIGELVKGVFLSTTHDRLVAVVERLRRDEGIDGIILGGTELALILTEPAIAGIPGLDTAGLHVDAIVRELLA